MQWIDTHAHVYLPQFDEDREEWIKRAKDAGVNRIYLPNIDLESIPLIENLTARDPEMFVPMMGLHPCDVKENYQEVLAAMRLAFDQQSFCAVGEIGIDLYWDKSTLPLQIEAFKTQIEWAIALDLPFVIHARDSFDEIFAVLDQYDASKLKGIFHCFTGTLDQAKKVMNYGGFMMGIGGVITYPKSDLAQVVQDIPLEYLVLETDSPFLPPVPYRGKRNESSYIPIVGQRIADAKSISLDTVAEVTTANALAIFRR
ncbi:MAG: TatD family hydrolase [Flavobacteriales bacterium]